MTNDELLTGSAVAEMLGVSDETVRRWAEVGQIDHITLPSGQRRYRRSVVEAILTPATAAGE
jgi:excisionase family DNA binding protein